MRIERRRSDLVKRIRPVLLPIARALSLAG
jgi:hypothetical protein